MHSPSSIEPPFAVLRCLPVITLLLIFAAAPAEADPFDCTHASTLTWVGQMVCANPALHAADQAESDAYNAALSAALDRRSLREDERVWFQSDIVAYSWFLSHGMKVDPVKVQQSYAARTTSLHELGQRWRVFRRPLPTDRIGTACLALPSAPDTTDCTVSDSGSIGGATVLRYQRQSYHHEAAARAVIVFGVGDDAKTQWVPIAAAYDNQVDFAAPAVVDSPDGKLMMLAGAADQADTEGISALYRFAGGTLEDIDDRTWLDTLKSRLPEGLLFAPGIVTDYGKMTATATIAQSESDCCPIGGHAIITLGIENQRVVVTDVTFEPQ
ncbi:MAG TPA: hypothetical protein VKV32_03120 [Stellaceae bacterium]|nr:hypothetical protein [Stellaceae bacterium]